MAGAGLHEVETYVYRRQNTVAQYIATRPIMDLCLAAKRRPGPRVAMRWWEQERLDLEGMRTAARKAEGTVGGGRDGRDRDCDGRLVKWGGCCSKHNLRDRA